MSFDLKNFCDDSISTDYLDYLVDHYSPAEATRCERLWDYFRNPMLPASAAASAAFNASSRPYFQAQEMGLPARITGVDRLAGRGEKPTDLRRKEVVIENDIGWRVHTMVDFLFGKRPAIRSLASSPELAAAVEKVLAGVIDANGGNALFQEMALLGSVYGFVDIALRVAPQTPAGGLAQLPTFATASSGPSSLSCANSSKDSTPSANANEVPRPGSLEITDAQVSAAVAAAARLQLETIDAPRVVPVLEEYDYRRLRYWVQRFFIHPSKLAESRRPWTGILSSRRGAPSPATLEVVEILSPTWWQRYENRQLVAEGPNGLGVLPIAHVQNLALAGSYGGLGDVEPLIPLQDELNTRLSDRAQRVTYQSFKMYLGKGIDDFLERPVGPGQMWATQNLDATIEEFGTDAGSPSEDVHIEQVRAAMDKISAVSPLAAGLVAGNVGYLTSGTALKVVLGGLIARTARKRVSYGAGIQQIAELVLAWLDRTGVLKTRPEDRRIEIHWPNVIPTDESEMLRNAQIKSQLGLDRGQVLAELGYDRQTVERGA